MKENTKLEWTIVILLGIIAYFLAFIGFHTYFVANGVERNLLDLTFHSIKIFGMDMIDDYVSPLPITLEIARWLAPGVLIYTAIKGIIYLVGRTFLMLRVKRYRDHVVIEGVNQGSTFLINDLVKKGMKVVALAEEFTEAEREKIEREGVCLIAGTLKDKEIFKGINIGKASYVLCLEKNDDKNIASSVHVFNYLSELNKTVKPKIFAHIDDIGKLRELREIKFFRNLQLNKASNSEFDVRIFSVKERVARMLFNLYSPDKFLYKSKPSDSAHSIVMIGDGELTETILVHFARMCQYSNFKKTIINLFHCEERFPEILQNNSPMLKESIDLTTTLIDPDVLSLEMIAEQNNANPVDAIYIISSNDEEMAKIVNRLSAINFGKQVNVVMVIDDPGSILGKWFSVEFLGDLIIHKYNITNEVFSEEAIIGSGIDNLAKMIHDDYLAKIKEAGRLNPEKETHCEWEYLSEDIKNQNRFQADHLWVKLRAIGCKAVPINDKAEEYDFTKDPDLVEMLSKVEHNRWEAHMWLNGWKYGAVRNDKKKIHTDLVEYEKLSDEVKQYDRNTILNIKHILSIMNLKIVKEQ